MAPGSGQRPPNPTIEEVRSALNSVDFPLSKEALVECAETGDVDDSVLRQLRALPLADYESVDEVLRSVDLADQRGR